MLNATLISTITQKTLAFFCLHPDLKFHGRETARKMNLRHASVQRSIKALEKKGILSSERKGKMIFYQLDESRPLIRQYKTMALLCALEPLLSKLRKITDQIILYGSSANGKFLSDSDVDILIVTSHPKKVEAALFSFRKTFAKEIRPVITSLAEWMDYEKKDPVFYNEVTRGLLLHQSEYYESRV